MTGSQSTLLRHIKPLAVCQSVCLYSFLPVYLSVYLSNSLSFYLTPSLSVDPLSLWLSFLSSFKYINSIHCYTNIQIYTGKNTQIPCLMIKYSQLQHTSANSILRVRINPGLYNQTYLWVPPALHNIQEAQLMMEVVSHIKMSAFVYILQMETNIVRE